MSRTNIASTQPVAFLQDDDAEPGGMGDLDMEERAESLDERVEQEPTDGPSGRDADDDAEVGAPAVEAEPVASDSSFVWADESEEEREPASAEPAEAFLADAEPDDEEPSVVSMTEEPEEPLEDVYVAPLTWDGALADYAAAEKRAAAMIDESRVEAEAVRLRGRQEARHIIQRAEDRAQQILELCETEAAATERRAQARAQAILIEGKLRLDVFAQDHGEPPPAEVEPPGAAAEPATEPAPSDPVSIDAAGEAIEEAPRNAETVWAQEDTAGEFVWPEAGVSEPDVDGELRPEALPAGDSEPSPQPLRADEPSNGFATPSRVPVEDSEDDQLLVLSALPNEGETAVYRVTGPLTFARIMAIEEALGSFSGVTAARVTPESNESATIAFVSNDPEDTILGLLESVPGLALGGVPGE